ncbi:MAG: hypothetical protein ACLUVV_05270 [Christensenellales bacterium]
MHPTMIPLDHPLNRERAFNAVYADTDAAGQRFMAAVLVIFRRRAHCLAIF